jgi:hypothetical protein
VWHPASKGAALPARDAPQRRGVSLDRTMIHLRGGWKEVKVGSFFDFAAKGERAKEEYQVRAFDTTYCMWLGSVEQFAPCNGPRPNGDRRMRRKK